MYLQKHKPAVSLSCTEQSMGNAFCQIQFCNAFSLMLQCCRYVIVIACTLHQASGVTLKLSKQLLWQSVHVRPWQLLIVLIMAWHGNFHDKVSWADSIWYSTAFWHQAKSSNVCWVWSMYTVCKQSWFSNSGQMDIEHALIRLCIHCRYHPLHWSHCHIDLTVVLNLTWRWFST